MYKMAKRPQVLPVGACLSCLSLFRLSHAVFIDLVGVVLRTFGKRAVGIGAILFAVDLQPFA